MKKALALVLALVLALSMAVSALAVEPVLLVPQAAKGAAKVEIEVVDALDEKYVLYTTPALDLDNVALVYETVYYVALPDQAWKDVKVTANGNATAELVKYDAASMNIDGIDVVFGVFDKAGNKVANFSADNDAAVITDIDADGLVEDWEAYAEALEYAKLLNNNEKVTYYTVKVLTNVNIIKVTIANNFSAHYTEGSVVVEATLNKKAYKGEMTTINDVTIFEYEQVKWAAANYKDGAALVLNDGGYSDYFTAENGYGWEYDEDALREDTGALVVSTTAFRAIEGKTLAVKALPENDFAEVTVTLKEIAAGQKGVNFMATAAVKGIDLEDDLTPTEISIAFLGNQVIKGEFEIEVALDLNWYELREVFGLKVEEDDIISYYIVDGNGKVVGGKEVDYMTADLTENVEFTVKGSNSTLGEYKLVLEVPAAEAGEANPNTGAESVVGVVAALAVVSVATAAAVSLKK